MHYGSSKEEARSEEEARSAQDVVAKKTDGEEARRRVASRCEEGRWSDVRVDSLSRRGSSALPRLPLSRQGEALRASNIGAMPKDP